MENRDFDALIVGGGAAGLSCALLLGSALSKPFCADKRVGIIAHQRASHLSSALLNNVLGVPAGSAGKDILSSGVQQLETLYPEVEIIQKEKVLKMTFSEGKFQILTNKNSYTSSIVVLATGYAKPFTIDGLEEYLVPHKKSKPSKDRVQLSNMDHFVKPGLYVAGSLAGHRSQYAIACGSGAAVATDILTLWNDGEQTKVHDKLK
ncbi:FAD-dependent oxidoreductase [Salinimicrobium sediminilitoris]|uniref:FAD-dependent oxidoreductase n=1 Tax=Salinimicrobium sediminilitoris TaxID=2876715 RepID=UPI001E5D6A5B|nr:FAD-dependent oxidoreductase [Salinimicrobium sediminilitoris]